jgi:hypothetical protein
MKGNHYSDTQFERIKAIFNTSEIPHVTDESLNRYFEYLKKSLTCPCMLTGIESMGYFSWEERFNFGYENKEEYQRLKRERGSYTDKYELRTLNDATVNKEEGGIVVKVQRIPNRKRFTIPLSELQAIEKESDNYQMLNDYTVWFVNC